MFRHLLAVWIGALFPLQAHAADYRTPMVPPMVPPMPVPAPVVADPVRQRAAFDWGRCFFGAQVGQKSTRADMTIPTTPYLVTVNVDNPVTFIEGPFAGAQAGCNAMSETWVFGLELEGAGGAKKGQNCASRVDPLAYCIDYFKDWQAFATAKIGRTFDGFGACDCAAGAILVYTRFGVGYTRTDISANFNQVAYRVQQTQSPGPTNTYQPVWGNNFDMVGRKEYFSPLLGFGVEYALSHNWTVRGEFSAMYSPASGADLRVSKLNYVGGTIPPDDSTGVARHVRADDVLQTKLREVETKVSLALNRFY